MTTTYKSKHDFSFIVPDIATLTAIESAVDTYCQNRADGSYFTLHDDRSEGGLRNIVMHAYINVTGKADVATVFNQIDAFVAANIPDAMYRKAYSEDVVPDEE